MKSKITFLAIALALRTLPAAVPLKWTVETSRLQPVAFDMVRGETLALEAAFNSYGTPIELPSNAALFYQTNGMESVWWTIPATVTSNRISAVFAPTNDPGASVIVGFLGSTGEIYRAAFTLRFRHGPGATPNVIQIPTVNYNINLTGEPTINGTNLTDFVANRAESDPHAPGIVSNVVTKAYVEALGISASGGSAGGINTNAVNDLIAVATNAMEAAGSGYQIIRGYKTSGDIASDLWDIYTHGSDYAYYALNDSAGNQISETYYPKSQGDAWSAYWDGDDVRVTVTNYDSAANLPSLFLEQKTNTTSQATNAFRTVWREMSHWEKFLGTNWNWNASWSGFASWNAAIEDELDEKADRAWGFYDSHTGQYAPDGYTQISSSNILISAGMGYQKTISARGDSYWVLTANEPFVQSGTTNGSFRISDTDGNVQIEIVKGDKRSVGAQCGGVSVSGRTLVATYTVIASEHPTIEVCEDLLDADWHSEESASCPATVTWSGSSGSYVANVTPTSASATRIFVRATYMAGFNTYVRHACPVSLTKIILDGTTYTLGTNTIGGSLVLTLTPSN